jgi:hypothetical protein
VSAAPQLQRESASHLIIVLCDRLAHKNFLVLPVLIQMLLVYLIKMIVKNAFQAIFV